MDDLQLGKLIGKVDALVGTVETMRAENSADHATVKEGFSRVETRIDALDAKLDKKAETKQVDDQDDRIDKLESLKDKLWFTVPAMTLGGSFIVGALLHLTGAA